MAGAERLHAEAGGVEGQAFVYVIGSDDGPQKIGMSANPASRLRGLQTSSPHRLKLLVAVDIPAANAVAVERHAHATLSLHRLSGEWFEVAPDQAVTAVQEAAVSVAIKQAERAAARQQSEQIPLFPADPVRLGPLTITSELCRAARGLLNWTGDDLAREAKVALNTVRKFEAGKTVPMPNNLSAIQGAFERSGISFIPENGEGAGVRLRKAKDGDHE